jgi:hypothetical protein
MEVERSHFAGSIACTHPEQASEEDEVEEPG